jgi:hypothetical protein
MPEPVSHIDVHIRTLLAESFGDDLQNADLVVFRLTSRMLPEFVWDASVLEGNPFTFLEVKTLYHRKDPIIVGAAMSKGSWNDHAFWRCTWKSALIYDELAKNGLQNIKGVYFHPSGVGRKLCVISIKQAFAGHATEAGYLASQTRGAAYAGKWVIVVDDDVDPYDIDDVLWAVCSRADPAETGIIRDGWGGALFSKDRRSRGVIFAVTPFDKLEEYSQRTCFITDETKKATIEKWSKVLKGRWDKR